MMGAKLRLTCQEQSSRLVALARLGGAMTDLHVHLCRLAWANCQHRLVGVAYIILAATAPRCWIRHLIDARMI